MYSKFKCIDVSHFSPKYTTSTLILGNFLYKVYLNFTCLYWGKKKVLRHSTSLCWDRVLTLDKTWRKKTALLCPCLTVPHLTTSEDSAAFSSNDWLPWVQRCKTSFLKNTLNGWTWVYSPLLYLTNPVLYHPVSFSLGSACPVLLSRISASLWLVESCLFIVVSWSFFFGMNWSD